MHPIKKDNVSKSDKNSKEPKNEWNKEECEAFKKTCMNIIETW